MWWLSDNLPNGRFGLLGVSFPIEIVLKELECEWITSPYWSIKDFEL